MTARPHDALFRSAFEDPEHATAELRHVLPEALVAALDWSTLRTEPGAYVDSELADRYSDLLFSAHTGGRRLLVYLLLEHQSTVDEHMPLRMLIYMTRIWERWSSERPAERLPPIVPVLVSHARTRPVLTRMHDLFAPPPSSIPGLAEHVPQFRILLDDIASATDDDLHDRALAAFPKVALWFLRDARNGDALLERLQQWADALRAVATAPNGLQAMHRLIRYLDLVLSDRRFEQIHGMIRGLSDATEEAVMTYTERVFAEGEAKGEAKGRAEARRDVLLKLLTLKFGPLEDAVATRVHAAEPATLETWLERLVSASTLAHVLDDDTHA